MKNFSFTAPLRKIHTVFLHCSASDNPDHDDIAVIADWHKARGFRTVGYHFFIQKSGDIQPGRDLEQTPAAQFGFNRGTIAICLHGLRAERFTPEQFNALRALCTEIQQALPEPPRFRGHCEVAAKACPVFDYRAVLSLDRRGYRNIPPIPKP